MFEFVTLPVELPELNSVEKEGQRYYPVPNGKFYPSITTITSFRKRSFFAEWRKKVGPEVADRITAAATGRGTTLHAIIEEYLNNRLNLDDFSDKPLPTTLFKVAKPALDRIGRIYALEAPLYSDLLGIAGRVDCIAEFDNELAVIDFKSSTKEKKEEWIENYFVQETAYAVMFFERTGIKPKKIVTIIATEEGSCQVIIKTNLDHYYGLLKDYVDEFTRGTIHVK